MPQDQPGQTQQPQQIEPVPQDQQVKLAQKIIQSRLPKPVQISAKNKLPKWSWILAGLAVLAIIIGVALATGKINLPGTRKDKSVASTRVATSSSTTQGTKNTCQIYARKGAASKTSRNPTKEGDREITVKFREGSEIRLRDGKFVSLCGEDLSQINNFLSIYSNLSIKRSFTQSEDELAAEFKAAKQNDPNVADLNLFYLITVQEGTPLSAVDYLINKLNEFSVVEVAYPESQPAPAP